MANLRKRSTVQRFKDWSSDAGTIATALALLIAVVAIIGLAILWPFVVIWAVNLIFGTTIAFTFLTWLAVIVLISLLRINVNVTRR